MQKSIASAIASAIIRICLNRSKQIVLLFGSIGENNRQSNDTIFRVGRAPPPPTFTLLYTGKPETLFLNNDC